MLSLSSLYGGVRDWVDDLEESTRSLCLLGIALGSGLIFTVAIVDNLTSLSESLRMARAELRAAVSLQNAPITEPDAALDTAGGSQQRTGLTPNLPDGEAVPETINDPARSTAFLEQRFKEAAFDLEAIRAGQKPVPRLSAGAVPVDLEDLVDIARRKTVFIQMVLPLILLENERILADRARLATLSDRSDWSAEDQAWLTELGAAYKTDANDFDTLLRRVDAIPPSLAIAQAAVESGWGTSRFAVEGNALFGQWVWGDTAQGIVPSDRSAGEDHKIRAFDTPYDAVASYALNLNRHPAYAHLRALRSEARAAGFLAAGTRLAAGLESYSEKGTDYINLIRRIIETNRLEPLDKARLGTKPA